MVIRITGEIAVTERDVRWHLEFCSVVTLVSRPKESECLLDDHNPRMDGKIEEQMVIGSAWRLARRGVFLLKVLFLPGTLLLVDAVLGECAYIDQI